MYKQFRFSSSIIEQISNDIKSGAADKFVADFFASRPEWNEEDKTNEQTDNQTEKKEEAKA